MTLVANDRKPDESGLKREVSASEDQEFHSVSLGSGIFYPGFNDGCYWEFASCLSWA
jgi:hypothetical protein